MENIMNKKVSEITDEDTKLGRYFLKLQSAYRTGEGDQEALIELVAAAMGKRSQRQFAADMGVNVSSVSRILNGKVSEVGDMLLAKIAANADPASGVTIEKLMQAQGMVEAENRAQLGRKFEESCRRIFADELLKRGKSVSYPKEQSRESRYLCDFEIETDALTKGDGRWLVEAKMMTSYTPLPVGSGRTRIWLDSAMAAYYRDEKVGRISLIVDVRTAFEQLKAELTRVPIRDEISIILISIGEGRILDEFVAPLADGSTPEFTFAAEN
jgi:transcriptional regulator with XRE-family HTH domain